jgi:hypothetical protein
VLPANYEGSEPRFYGGAVRGEIKLDCVLFYRDEGLAAMVSVA